MMNADERKDHSDEALTEEQTHALELRADELLVEGQKLREKADANPSSIEVQDYGWTDLILRTDDMSLVCQKAGLNEMYDRLCGMKHELEILKRKHGLE